MAPPGTKAPPLVLERVKAVPDFAHLGTYSIACPPPPKPVVKSPPKGLGTVASTSGEPKQPEPQAERSPPPLVPNAAKAAKAAGVMPPQVAPNVLGTFFFRRSFRMACILLWGMSTSHRLAIPDQMVCLLRQTRTVPTLSRLGMLSFIDLLESRFNLADWVWRFPISEVSYSLFLMYRFSSRVGAG